jgi:hypothetical protein
MKLHQEPGSRRSESSRSSRVCRGGSAFTIPEIMITMTIVVMILATVIACHLLGLRMYELTKAKLGASDDARKAIGVMVSEIKSAKSVRIGEGDLGKFNEVGLDTPHIGNAIQISTTTNTNAWVRYFWDPADQKLKRGANGDAVPKVIASAVSNRNSQAIFSIEDYQGMPLLNNASEFVVGVNLQFYQLLYPYVEIGPGKQYDYYQLQTKVTPRAP